jgi:hypothetical protein
MNYRRLFPILLLATSVAHAQKAKEFIQFNGGEFYLVPSPAPAMLYANLADTTSKPALRLSRTHQVLLVGEFSSRWAVIRHSGFAYFIRQADLADLSPGQTAKQLALLVNAPLPFDASTHLIDFTKVVQVPGASQNELYARGKVWLADTFPSTQKAIQVDDKDAGILIGKGWQPAYVYDGYNTVEVMLWYTVKLAFKEGRYRYNLTDFGFQYIAPRYDLTPGILSAEGLTAADVKTGMLSAQAKGLTRALNRGALHTSQDLERRMNKLAIGADF